jgi:hypothetical protein
MTEYERLSLALLNSINVGISRVLVTLVAIRPMPDETVLEQAKSNENHLTECAALSRIVSEVFKSEVDRAKQS